MLPQNPQQNQHAHASTTPDASPSAIGLAARTGVVRARPARVLRLLAGAPAGAAPSRRGSFLVLVVGVLAMIAVIAILYAAVGNTDRGRAIAVTERKELQQYPDQVADYIASIIGDDVVDAGYREVAPGVNIRSVDREGFDYPSTDWNFVSSVQALNGAGSETLRLFTPTGGFRPASDAADPARRIDDPRFVVPCDPWLASTTPTFLNYDRQRNPPANKPHMANVDWAQITNIAPDGRFVNLHGLRNNFRVPSADLSASLSLFRAADADLFDPTRIPQADPANSTTDFGEPVAAYDPASPINFRPAAFTMRQVGLYRPAVDGRSPNDPTYLLYQYADADGDGYLDSRWMELVDLSSGLPVPVLQNESGIRYFIAARIIDASALINVNTATDFVSNPDKSRPVGSSPAEIDLRRILALADVALENATAGGDALGRTYTADGDVPGVPVSNPNTDDDFVNPGANPGGYDSNGNLVQRFDPTANNNNGQIARSQAIGRYGYDALRLFSATGVVLPVISPEGIQSQGNQLNQSVVGIANRITDQGANYLGVRGNASRQSWDFITPISELRNTPADVADQLLTSPAVARARAYERQLRGIQGTSIDNLYTFNTNVNPNRYDVQPVAVPRGRFGLDSMLELATFWGVNDPSVRSTLEAVVDGRDGAPDAVTNLNFRRNPFGPLRSNRVITSERVTVAERPTDEGASRTLLEKFQYLRDIDPRKLLTTESGTRLGIRSAPGVSVIPEAENLRSPQQQLDFSQSLNALRPSEARTEINPLLDAASTVTPQVLNPQGTRDVAEMFGVRAEDADRIRTQTIAPAADLIFKKAFTALAPFANLPGAWTDAQQLTMAYGHTGPELALLSAARWAANLVDMYDRDEYQDNPKPFGATVLLNEKFLVDVDSNPIAYPGWSSGLAFDAHAQNPLEPGLGFTPAQRARGISPNQADQSFNPNNRLANETPGSRASVSTDAVNVYGIEAQPFITGVSTITVFSDIRRGESGEPDSNESNQTEPRSINRAIHEDNPEFMFRAIAFQLTNPFSQTLVLGEPAVMGLAANPDSPTPAELAVGYDLTEFPDVRRLTDYQYIQFGGRNFLLMPLIEQTAGSTNFQYPPLTGSRVGVTPRAGGIRIKPGETVVVYALSQLPREIVRRMQAAGGSTAVERPINAVRDIIRTHLAGRKGTETQNPQFLADENLYWIGEFDARTTANDPENPRTGGHMGFWNDFERSPGSSGRGRFESFKAPPTGRTRERVFGELIYRPENPDPAQFSEQDVEKTGIVKLYRVVRAGSMTSGSGEEAEVNTEPRGTTDARAQWPDSIPDTQFMVPAPSRNQRLFMSVLPNDPTNDLLQDRFRLAPEVTLDGYIGDGTLQRGNRDLVDIGGTDAVNSSNQNENDDGLTISIFRLATRRPDPRAKDGPLDTTRPGIPVGAIPAYCIESKVLLSGTPAQIWNLFEPTRPQNRTGRNITLGAFTDPVNNSNYWVGQKSLREWTDRLRLIRGEDPSNPQTRRALIQSVSKQARYRVISGTTPDPNFSAIPDIVVNGVTVPFERAYPQIVLNDNRFRVPNPNKQAGVPGATGDTLDERSNLRLTDLLLALAVGPIHDPFAVKPASWLPSTTTEGARTLDDARWTTLSEALAATLGYEEQRGLLASLAATDRPLDRVFAAQTPFANTPISSTPPPFDRGHFALDLYTPFFDADTDGAFSPGGTELQGDARVGQQMPLALSLLDTFSVRPVWVDASKTKQIFYPGVLNVNTAPITNLRAVPMLAPIDLPDPLIRMDSAGRQRTWWYQWPERGDALPFGRRQDLQPHDIAATIASYRDMSFVEPRKISRDAQQYSIGTRYFDFGYQQDGTRGPVRPDQFRIRQARASQSRIEAVSETLGLRSPSEILAARFRGPASGPNTDFTGQTASWPNNIDSLAFRFGVEGDATTPPTPRPDDDPSGSSYKPFDTSYEGLSYSNHFIKNDVDPTDTNTPPRRIDFFGPNTIPNDYEEKLAIAAGALGSTAVRSDVFLCWFIVHGYRESDVQNLEDNQPLVPSIARRFVLLVDRSNVTKKGQKPKILLFQEVPL